MRFLPTGEQEAFGRSLDAMLTAADVPSAARAWAAGDHAPGRELFRRLAGAGVFDPELPAVERVVAFVELGRHAVPGPLAETVAAGVLLGRAGAPEGRLWREVAEGVPTAVVLPGGGRYALDPDAAGAVLVAEAGRVRAAPGHGPLRVSSDPVRRLAVPLAGGEVVVESAEVGAAAVLAGETARLLTAAQCLGVGVALLERTVGYVRGRVQFGSAVGGFQAVKHRLADVAVGVEFARAVVWGAGVTRDAGDVAAAKVVAGEAGYAAARAALQLHGAIGYTDELDLSLWLRKARPLLTAWGTPAACRTQLLPAPPRT
ncbi:acyl-CoA dehydrogenase [Streptomyces sp. NPDC001985]|uniref:acyl-CoA dehydrogenase n=1 Tax=Streptomyces sp. NPDC001985 TaxID=3154406 RepID=UPI003326AD24